MKHARKSSVVIVSLLIIAAGIVAALELTDTTHLFHKASNKPSTADNTGVPGPINYGPPTDVEKQDSESHKDNTPPASDSTTTKKKVEVAITTWVQKEGNIEVNGFVSGVVEDGGTCTLTLTSESTGQKVTTSRTAVANATNTSCGSSAIPVTKLNRGKWQAVLSYNSATSTGNSDAVEVEVQ